jgi:hypothetical protein
MTDAERVLARCIPDGECLIWQGAVSLPGRANPRALPYGRIGLRGKVLRTHRVVFADAHGTLRPGAVVMHTCDRPRCCRVQHLQLGTQRDNVLDCRDKGRRPSTRGVHNGRARLRPDDVRAIRGSTETYHTLATRYGVTTANIRRIVSRQTWRHIE